MFKNFKKAPLTVAICSFMPVAVVAEEVQEAAQLDKVVVTGQKVERSLQDTVDSVRVIDAEQIEDERLVDMYDVIDRTPNVTGRTGVGFSIRGIDAFGVSGIGNSFLASVYMDGAPVPYRAIQQGPFSAWDVSQIEILRGPQSTLQGRNALAGAVIVRTEEPTYEWDGKVRLVGGSYGRKEAAVAGGGAIIEDQLAFRLSAERREFDGYIKNPHRDENGNYSKDTNLRGKLLFEPKAVDGLKVLYTFNRQDNEIGVPWQSPDSKDRYDDPQVFFNDRTREMIDGRYQTLEATYELSDNLAVTSVTSYSDVEYSYDWDGDAGPDLNDKLFDIRNDKTVSQELRLNFNFDRVSGVAGAYYSDLDVKDKFWGARSYPLAEAGVTPDGLVKIAKDTFGLDTTTAVTGPIAAMYEPFDPARLDTNGDRKQEVTTQAVFTDVTVKVTDSVDVFAGVRYDQERQSNLANNDHKLISELPDATQAGAAVAAQVEAAALAQGAPAAAAQAAGQQAGVQTTTFVTGINGYIQSIATDASRDEPKEDKTFSAWLPKLGATYHFTDDASTSLSAQKGYRSGGVGTNIQQGTTYSYDPEYIWNYEWSLRTLWLDGRLAANANVFYLDWTDQQVSIQLSESRYDAEVVNAGKSNVKGGEFELMYFDSNFTGFFGLGRTETEFTKFVDRGNDLKGRRFANAPKWTANLGGTYRLDSGFVFNANANYQSESKAKINPETGNASPTDPTYDPKNSTRTVLNVGAGYEWDQVSLVLAVDNVMDTEYVEAANTGLKSETIGQPRMFSLRLEAKL